MSLGKEINDYIASFNQNVPSEKRAIMEQATAELSASDMLTKVIKTGDKAPDFVLKDQNGKEQRLSEISTGPKILTFYRGGWCPYCNLELKAYQRALADIKELGATLIAVTPETPDHSLSTIEKNNLEFLVLSDPGLQIAESYGLVFSFPDSLKKLYLEFGLDVGAANGMDDWKLPLASTLILASDLSVIRDFHDTDYRKRLDPSDVLETLRHYKA
ncbi:MAG: AhpC/TSA family protein [Pseudobacteriovorax sp.]|nr:AhpC/TSA family protein [Pseudobacteriovorax sp.]